MNRAIICEGPDASGKTTLARELSDYYGLEYRRPPSLSSTEGPTDPQGLIDWWENQNFEEAAVYDRTTYISDPIYRLATGTKSAATATQIANGIFRIMGKMAIVIFCEPPWKNQKQVLLMNRPGLKGLTLEQAEVVSWAYIAQGALWKEAHYEGTFRYDYTTDTVEALAKRLES